MSKFSVGDIVIVSNNSIPQKARISKIVNNNLVVVTLSNGEEVAKYLDEIMPIPEQPETAKFGLVNLSNYEAYALYAIYYVVCAGCPQTSVRKFAESAVDKIKFAFNIDDNKIEQMDSLYYNESPLTWKYKSIERFKEIVG